MNARVVLGLGAVVVAGLSALLFFRFKPFDPTTESARQRSVVAPKWNRTQPGATAMPNLPDLPIDATSTAHAREPNPHPVEPLDLYRRNIEQAKAGNARSQYRVSQALQACRGATKTQDRLDEILRTQSLTDDQVSRIKLRYEQCKEFAMLTPDIDSEITKWLHLAAENGDPLAKGYEGLLSYPNFDTEELKTLIRAALATSEVEAYSLAAMYYANVTPTENAELFEAWTLLSCEFDSNCDLAQERSRINSQYQMYQRAMIGSFESELRDKLEAGRWDQLGF